MPVFYSGTSRLHIQLDAMAIPVDGVSQNADNTFTIYYNPSATAGQIAQGNALAQGYDYRTYQSQLLSDLYQSLAALTVTQHNNIWTNISASVTGPPSAPRKYLLDVGPNAAAIFVMDWSIYQSGATGAKLTAAQNDLISMYVQDNPAYLINPPFDTSINVPGWVLAS